MSHSQVIVSAVYEPNESLREWWEKNKDNLDSFEKEYDLDNEVDWDWCEGIFRSTSALEKFTVKPEYHSGRGETVIEIVLAGKEDITDIRKSGLENILDEINSSLTGEFTLEAYYWYNGVDRPGGR